jgi:CRP-like cAMP-binding protein
MSAARLLGVIVAEPDLRRIQLASAISTTARWSYLVALLVIAYRLQGTLGLAVLAAVRTLPTIVAVPLAGAAGSRIPGRTLLTVAYLGRAIAIGVAALGGIADMTVLVLAAAGVDAVLGTLRRPVQASLLPLITRSPSDLVAANIGTTTGEGLAGFLGPLAGAAILGLGGPVAVLGVSAAGFGIAALLVARLTVEGGSTGAATGSTMRSLRDGAGALLRGPIPRLVAVGFLVQAVVQGALNVLLVPAATTVLGLGEPGVGHLYAAMGLGGLVGALVAIVAIGPGRLGPTFLVALAAWGVPLIVVGLVATGPVAASMLALVGVANAALDVAGYSLLQRTLPTASRAAGMALFEGVNEAALGIGGVIAPLAITGLAVQGSLVAAGAVLLVVAGVITPLLLRHNRTLAGRTATVETLRRLPLFAPLRLATVEELAAGARVRLYPPHAVLMREGDLGDLFHVITSGTVDVTVGGNRVAVLGPGDGVGEIALLNNSVRTATVEALEPVKTLAIDGAAFTAAVTSQTGSLAAATVMAETRLDEQVGVLDQLGADAFREGRWEDAVALYKRSRLSRSGEGKITQAALLADWAASILSDQGRLAEAEALLQEALAQLAETDYELGSAIVTANLGTVAARSGRYAEAMVSLRDAEERLQRLGAADRLDDVQARMAECLVLAGFPRQAEERAREALARVRRRADRQPLRAALERTLGWCALLGDDPTTARARFDLSQRTARTARADYELALTLRASLALPAAFAGDRGAAQTEASAILARLGVDHVVEPSRVAIPA